MKKIGFLIGFIVLIYPRLSPAEDTFSEAKQLAENANQILSELEEASQKGDSAKAQALGTVYAQTTAKIDQDTENLKAQGRDDEASTIEETVQQGTLRHHEVLERVREQVPEQARFGIDRALQVSGRGSRVAPSAIQGNVPPQGPPPGIGRGLNPVQEERQEGSGGGPPPFAGGFKAKGGDGHGRRPF